MSLLETYFKELEADTVVNEFNLKDVQLKLPAIKHKWVGRYIRHKQELQKLQKTKDRTSKNLVEETIKKAPVDLKGSAGAVARVVENSDTMVQINDKIDELKLVIELLERAEKIFSSMTYDVKNICQIIALETQ